MTIGAVRITDRFYAGRFRVHHGLVGAFLTALGAVLTYHDRHDFPWRLRDPHGR